MQRIIQFFTFILFFSGLTIAENTANSTWNNDDIFSGSSWYSIGKTHYLQNAENAEIKGDFSTAAQNYKKLFEVLVRPENKAKALFLAGQNFKRANEFYSAFTAYNDLVTRYTDGLYFEPALKEMLEISKYFTENRNQFFSSNYEHAEEVDKAYLEIAPYHKESPNVILNLAKLQAESWDFKDAIPTYKKVLELYSYDANAKSTALFSLAEICEEMAVRADNDASLSTEGLALIERFLKEFPEDKRVPEAKNLRKDFRNRIAMYYTNIGEFYTYKANYAPLAAKRYLQLVLQLYSDTIAAPIAEAILAKLDPDYKFDPTKYTEEMRKMEDIQRKILSRYDKNYNPENKQERFLPVDKKSDKWLIPLPDLGEKKDEK